jgi:hypothetical protein
MFITTASRPFHTGPCWTGWSHKARRLPENEKLISPDSLIRKQLEANGLTSRVSMTDLALLEIIRYFTREAVRNLEDLSPLYAGGGPLHIKGAKFAIQPRHVRNISEQGNSDSALRKRTMPSAWLQAWPGPRWGRVAEYRGCRSARERVYHYRETGDVMQESAQAAMSYVAPGRISAGTTSTRTWTFIHVPEGATKDSPSRNHHSDSNYFCPYRSQRAP